MHILHLGPANGKVVLLRRSPKFLRVQWLDDGTWEPLDMLDDEPQESSDLHVYQRRKDGEYQHMPGQPAEFQMRDTQAWQAWCLEQLGKEPITKSPQ